MKPVTSASMFANGVRDLDWPTAEPGLAGSGSLRQARLAAIVDGVPMVDFPDSPLPAPIPARTTVLLEADRVGCDVLVAFMNADVESVVIVGCLLPSATPASRSVTVEGDGERLTLSADREIVLRCGEASVTLTKAGKIILRGTYVLSRSSGVNQIKGGSVHIN